MKKMELAVNFLYIIAMLVCAYWVGKFFSVKQTMQLGFYQGYDTVYERMFKDCRAELDGLRMDSSSIAIPFSGHFIEP